MRTTIISKSKNRGSQTDGPSRYNNRFIGLVCKVRGAANADNDNIEVQKSRLLKPSPSLNVVIPQTHSLGARH
jgi:hypothetical protein